jgi:ABC-type nitrate/sulfonate/bicarbonate transport system permease component
MTGIPRTRPRVERLANATGGEPRKRPGVSKQTAIAWLIPLLVICTGIVAWEIGVRIDNTPRWFLPRPTDVARELIESRAMLWRHTWTTLQEMLLGLGLAIVLGVALAVALASSRLIERSLYPLLVASQAVPIIALAPILLIWFGYGLTPKVIVVVLTCFFPIVVATIDGLRSADRDAINLLRSMGANRGQIMRVVRVPAAMPAVFSGVRIASAWSVIGAIVGEWVGASQGLGYLMTRSQSQFQTPRLYAAVLIAALLGITLFALVSLIERLAMPWRRIERGEQRR